MENLEIFNNLNPGSLIWQNNVVIHVLSVFLLNLISYMYIILKFYKLLCYSKMTFEWLPMINPYVWPFSFFHLLTAPYFKLWSRILPTVRFEKSSVEISGIIALEALNSLIFICVRLTQTLISILEEAEKVS